MGHYWGVVVVAVAVVGNPVVDVPLSATGMEKSNLQFGWRSVDC